MGSNRLRRVIHVGGASLTLLAGIGVSQATFAQTLFSRSHVSVGNSEYTNVLYALSEDFSPTGAPTFASANTSFSGMDSAGNSQIMGYSGSASASSEYGRLHSSASASVTNPYYNLSNTPYFTGSSVDTSGSPNYFGVAGFTGFTDELQYGGVLAPGYNARYVFHLGGANSGSDVGAFLGVTIGSNITETHFNMNPGVVSEVWSTQSYSVNGIVPEHIDVGFSAQFNSDLSQETEGLDFSGTANFSATLTLLGIEMRDTNGNLVSGWTVTSASGTEYDMILPSAVPEPGSFALFSAVGITSVAVHLRRKKIAVI